MTLWVVVLLTVVAFSFSISSRRGSASTRNLKEDTQAYYAALTAYEEVLSYLLTDPDPTTDFLDEEGNFRTDVNRPPVTGQRTVGGAEVEVRLADEESRLNINGLSMAQLMEMFARIGVPLEERQSLADSVLDWKDEDDDHRLSGAEDEYYETFGYKTKDGPFDVPNELLLVKGITNSVMFGGEDILALEPMITTFSSGLNVNTVPTKLLSILGVSGQNISNLEVNRAVLGGLRAVPPGMPQSSRTTSMNFRIQVVARMGDAPLAVRITSVVRRQTGTKGARLTTIYWKEDIEGSGT
jgi:general secretion pathway protein K